MVLQTHGDSKMVWAARLLDDRSNIDVESTFETQFQALGRPRDMMLIAADEAPQKRRMCVGVPASELLAPFDGFRHVAASDLPRAPVLVAGYPEVFQAMFEAIG